MLSFPCRSLMPSWEEVLLFNEIFSYFLSREETDPKVIMFFEVHVFRNPSEVMANVYALVQKYEQGIVNELDEILCGTL